MQQKQQLGQKLSKIADTLRGKMSADDFRDYILGFIFYKYLSEKMYTYANEVPRFAWKKLPITSSGTTIRRP